MEPMSKPTEFMKITFQQHLTESEHIEFSLVNLVTTDEQFFDYILTKISTSSAY